MATRRFTPALLLVVTFGTACSTAPIAPTPQPPTSSLRRSVFGPPTPGTTTAELSIDAVQWERVQDTPFDVVHYQAVMTIRESSRRSYGDAAIVSLGIVDDAGAEVKGCLAGTVIEVGATRFMWCGSEALLRYPSSARFTIVFRDDQNREGVMSVVF